MESLIVYYVEKIKELETEVAKGEQIIGKLLNEGDRAINENRKLKKKLEIAVNALEHYAKRENWQDIEIGDEECFSARFEDNGYKTAEKALAKIKEIK